MAEMAEILRITLDKAKALVDAEDRSSLAWIFKDRLKVLVGVLSDIISSLPSVSVSGRASEIEVITMRIRGFIPVADELVDELAYDALRLKLGRQDKKRNKVCNFFSPYKSFAIRLRMNRRFVDVIGHLKLLRRLLYTSGFRVEMNEKAEIVDESPQIIDYSAIESELMANSRDLQKIVDLLLNAENGKDLSIITIVGMGGIGKTTTAWNAYRNVRVVSHFDDRIWVTVSEDFSVERILREMFQYLTRTSYGGGSSDREIRDKLFERLKGKKYLLVLDDVWNEDSSMWDSLMKCLLKLGGSIGSKIMVTTRTMAVARAHESATLYELSVQSKEYSWNLFKQIAFGKGGAFKTPCLEEIGKRIVENCAGHPLLIKLTAGMLHSKKSKEEWMSIARNDLWYHLDRFDGILDIIKLCYDNLPSGSVKLCFISCGIFPKDSIIKKEELIQLWMAQGLLNCRNGSNQRMEDVGKKYLDILLNTCFLQDIEDDEFDHKTSCKMHDIVHDVALYKSKSCSPIMQDLDHIDCLALHLCLTNNEMREYRDANLEHLRTLYLVGTTSLLRDILAFSKRLNVLIVNDLLLEELPSSFDELRDLNYLDISKTKIVRLPDSITKLYNLQTLRLYDLIELPKNFENLEKLSHFYVENFKDLGKLKLLPPRFQDLINPSSFKACFRACLDKECPIEKLGQLEQPDKYSSLKIYRLEHVTDGKANEANLTRMSRLDNLTLHWNARRENCYDEDVLERLKPHSNLKSLTIQNFKGSKFPPWMLLCHLVKIELEDCCCCEHIPPLGHLSSLKVLRIFGMDNVKCIGPEFYGLENVATSSHDSRSSAIVIFPALREFTLNGMTSLETWSELLKPHLTVFPSLQKLEVEQCPKLTRLPDTLSRGSKYLRRLAIALCNNLTCLPEGFGRLEFIEDLELRGLPSVAQLSVGHCDNLKSLTIGGLFSCSEGSKTLLDTSTTTVHLTGGKELKSLPTEGKELKSLPEQLKYLSKLRYLTIWGYDKLERLPEWLNSFQSLQTLNLEFCWHLKYLPSAEALQQLKNLDQLNICFCPLLEERCNRGSRPEWNKISHIPRIKINYETIKSQS